MSRKMNAVAILVAAAALVATAAVIRTSIAAAGPVAAKQRVSIQSTTSGNFVLTPRTVGTLKNDTGTAGFCCWTERTIVREGQTIDINDPKLTLVGKRGTLVIRSIHEFVDVPGGYAVFTGTWKVVSGTGAYARVSGGGRLAGVIPPNGAGRWQRDGFLTSS